ncbi:MAG: SGNH/GDSL hydrolase family protein [Clostridia bacterium]|nr:SGNH/GDSL hydrolase family protein [Clostridia bacterium]
MADFTYEFENRKTPLETYEWDNAWIEQTNTLDKKHVMYVGDSISCMTRHVATKLSNNTLLFDGFGTSKGVDNAYFFSSLKLFIDQQVRRDAIIFNNGLHGWHLSDDEYEFYYEKLVKNLLDTYLDTPLFIVLTTSVTDKERDEIVARRNERALKIAKKYNLPVIDLFTVSKENKNLITDGVHFENAGYELFAKKIISVINDYIK